MKFPTRSLNLLLVWILFSLLAIAYIGQHPYLGLAIAIVGGIVLGILSFLYFEPAPGAKRGTHALPHAEDAAAPTPELTSDSSAESEVADVQDT